jgi:hypothetical protein
MLRIINRETKEFLRDDFHFNPETEIALTAPSSMGLFKPRWNGESWEEGATQEYIDNLKAQAEPHEPTVEERIQALEAMELERILGGGF